MGKHIFFLILYIGLSQVFPGEIITGIVVFHCAINIATNLKGLINRLDFITFYNIGILLASFANILFINKVKLYGTSTDVLHIYNFIDIRYIDEASLLWAIGNTFVFIGYELFSKKTLPSIAIIIDNKKLLDKIYYFIIGITLLNLTGNIINLAFIAGGVQKVLLLLCSVGTLFYSRLWVTENSKKYRMYAISICAIQTYIALFYSYIRLDLITPICILFLGYFIGKGDIKYLATYRIIPVILVFVVYFQFFQSFGGNRSHFIAAFINDQQTTASYSYVEGDEHASGTLLERISCISQMTNVIKLTKEKGFYNGMASAPLVAAFIPRAIWPDKPRVAIGSWCAVEIGAGTMNDFGYSNNSVNMTIPGELYLDFGWIGVAVGCLFWGAILAMFWNSAQFNESPFNLTGTLWGGYLLQGAMGALGADLQSVVTLISTYLVFLLIKKSLNQYANSRHRASVEG